MKTKPVIVIGAGGHANVVATILKDIGISIAAVVSPNPPAANSVLASERLISQDDQLITEFHPSKVTLVNGIGPMPNSSLHASLVDRFRELGYTFSTVISPTAIVSSDVAVGEGSQIMSGAIVQTGTTVGANTVINSGAIVEHDCIIGSYNHVAPGAVLSGGVKTGKSVHIGTGANIIQLVCIGDHATIGAGTTIARDVPANQTLIPAPSRIIS